MTWFATLAVSLILAKCLAQLILENLNRRHVRAHSDGVPTAFKNIVDAPTYAKSVEYTLAKSRLSRVELVFDSLVLLAVLFTGLLPWSFGGFLQRFGAAAWSQALWMVSIAILLVVLSLPLEWHAQFHLEDRFGFNTSTPRLWWLDRLKGLVLGLVIGYPLLILILKIMEWTGAWWWCWAWGTLVLFQLIMLVLGPILIMPLFNKFTPLPEGSLRERLFHLAERTGFHARSIQVMDGSKRSRHSNAFFTGFGQFRKIVLFDTLVQQLDEPELEAVLAHEIGHYKRKHIPRFLAMSAAASLLGFACLAYLARQPWFYESFGFAAGQRGPALLLFALLSGTVSFWLSPFLNLWSRRYEYQADAFAAEAMHAHAPLVGALRKLNEKNLSNLTPHPLYSGFYYSHPTLLERESALVAGSSH